MLKTFVRSIYGFIFLWDKKDSVDLSRFKNILDKSAYRGVDAQGIIERKRPLDLCISGTIACIRRFI